mmetsp:Transcript_7701/g.31210  ORF Transcript_7701/g.31210 Transcript_7701/m.31210 type:complete len:299 (-) Transcript_7701:267-1163(-)
MKSGACTAMGSIMYAGLQLCFFQIANISFCASAITCWSPPMPLIRAFSASISGLAMCILAATRCCMTMKGMTKRRMMAVVAMMAAHHSMSCAKWKYSIKYMRPAVVLQTLDAMSATSLAAIAAGAACSAIAATKGAVTAEASATEVMASSTPEMPNIRPQPPAAGVDDANPRVDDRAIGCPGTRRRAPDAPPGSPRAPRRSSSTAVTSPRAAKPRLGVFDRRPPSPSRVTAPASRPSIARPPPKIAPSSADPHAREDAPANAGLVDAHAPLMARARARLALMSSEARPCVCRERTEPS